MYIQPNTTIKLCQNVPLDASYTNSINFTSLTAQVAYFSGQAAYTLGAYSFQRASSNSLRVELPVNSLYKCNYMMFQNSAYGNKWFFAFITNVEYVNDVTSEITYEIDLLQTWLFDVDLGQCYIKRQHSTTDEIGDNITPEPISITDYIYNDKEEVISGLSLTMSVIIGVSASNVYDPGTYDNIYSGLTLYAFDAVDYPGISSFLESYVETPDNIVTMYMCPSFLLPGIPSGGKIPKGTTATTAHYNYNGLTGEDSLNGYVPKNKKMYTYPYNFLWVGNQDGEGVQLRYEFFEGGNPVLQVDGTFSPPVALRLNPQYYKGSENVTGYAGNQNLDVSISINQLPMCGWNNDSFKTWLAYNTPKLVYNTVRGVAGNVLGIAQGNISGGLLGISDTIAQTGLAVYDALLAPDQSRGTYTSSSIPISSKTIGFYKGRMSVTAQQARQIDDYFTMFGYAQNILATPNRSARPHWTYIQTVGCHAHGQLSAEDARKIEKIYDTGITWWASPSVVGNYSLDNSPA